MPKPSSNSDIHIGSLFSDPINAPIEALSPDTIKKRVQDHDVTFQLTEIQKTLLDYWVSLPKTAHPLVPCKADISLPRLYKIAPHLGMVEDISPGQVNVRLMGSTADDLLNENLTNQNVYDHYDCHSKDWAHGIFRNMFDTPAGLTNTLLYNFNKKPAFSHKTFHLPLCDKEGSIKYVISTFEQYEVHVDLRDYEPALVNKNDFSDNYSIDLGAGPGSPPFPLRDKGKNMVLKIADLAK